MALPRLLGISPGDHQRGTDLVWRAEAAAGAGLRVLILREPHLDERSYVAVARRLAVPFGSGLILHASNPAAGWAARKMGVGLHLPARLAPADWRPQIRGPLGVSAHQLEELQRAQSAGCSYATFSPIWSPGSKGSDPPSGVGLDALGQATGSTHIPVFALGGIRPDRAAMVRQWGAWGAASISAIFPPGGGPEESAAAVLALDVALRSDTLAS